MTRKTRDLKWAGASVAIAVALAAPAAGQAASGAEAAPSSAPRTTVAGGGLDRRDAAVAVAVFAAVLLLGLRGEVVVGAAIAGVATALGATARLVTGKPRSDRGWADWPSPAAARVAQKSPNHPPLRRPHPEHR